MILTNKREIEDQVRLALEKKMQGALNTAIFEIITQELPKGYSSSISDKLYAEQVGPGEFVVKASRVWTYLNDGTGIYGSHKGKGPGGEIVPVNVKALHFKNRELAAALGFKDENVFLKSVKGITPRFFWDRYFSPNQVKQYMAMV